MILWVAGVGICMSTQKVCERFCTYNTNLTVSKGRAETRGGLKASPDAPTKTVCTSPSGETGVGSGELGYEE